MMKNYLFILTLLFGVFTTNAQIITFVDQDAKDALLEHTPVIDTNNDGEISQAEAAVVTVLNLEVEFINVFPEVQFFTNLEELYIERNFLEALDVSQNLKLRIIDASPLNDIVDLTLASNNTVYEWLDFSDNEITSAIVIGDNASPIELLDFDNSRLESISFGNIPSIEVLNLAANMIDGDFSPGGIQEIGGDWDLRLNNFVNVNLCDLTSAASSVEVDLRNMGQPLDGITRNYTHDPALGISFNTFNGDIDDDYIYAQFDCEGNQLSLEDQLLDALSVYPNPTVDYVNINLPNVNIENIQYQLYNVTGSMVRKGVGNKVDFTSLVSGIYFLQINLETSSVTQKIIKQ